MTHALRSGPLPNHRLRDLAPIGVALLGLALSAGPSIGQTPPPARRSPPSPVFSIGQPPRWQPYIAATGMFDRDGTAGPSVLIGVNRPVTNPVTGLLDLTGEVYAAYAGSTERNGARLLATAPVFGLGAGVDWDPGTGRVDFLMSLRTPVRRSGLFGHGTMLRLDWLPARSQTIGVGFTVPIDQPLAGRTRPRHTD